MSDDQSKCRLGFSCAAMMMQPGLDANDCPNRQTCREMVRYEPDQRATFTRRVRSRRNRRVRESIDLSRHEAAVMMLMGRGCPRSIEDFGLLESIDNLVASLTTLRSKIETYREHYIAPEGCEVHEYNVKHDSVEYVRDETGELLRNETGEPQSRPVRIAYAYNKLAATRPIFEPAIEPRQVKVIHLSKDDDPRNLEARRGIERRNRLSMLRSQLRSLETAVNQSLINLDRPLESFNPVEPPDA